MDNVDIRVKAISSIATVWQEAKCRQIIHYFPSRDEA